MLVVVADQVVQSESVMGGDKVNTGARPATVALVKVAATGETIAQLSHANGVATPEATPGVTVFVIPFGPAHRKVANLIAVFADIPRLGDELHLGDNRILVDDIKERRHIARPVTSTHEGGCQVEAESVDTHLGDPVTQAIHDQLESA